MKRAVTLSTLAAAAVCLALAVRGRADSQTSGEVRPGDSLGLGLRLAGGWHAVVDMGAGPGDWIFGFTADGGVLINNTSREAGANQLRTSFGAWKRIASETVAITVLVLIEDPDGKLMMYEKVVCELTLSGDELSGPAVGYVYAPNQDPLDIEETPMVTLTGSGTARRIQVETLGE